MKKSDLQVYFYTLIKRFDNMFHDPKAQWSDYQRLASDALVVLGRTVDEWPDNEQEYFKTYHNGYDQGRFDEFADRVGKEQAEKVKGKLEQQESCPYCHGGEKHKALYIKDNKARRIVLNIKNDKHHPHSIAVWYKDFTIGDDYEPGGWIVKNVPLKYWTSINYCPMCGRPLNEEEHE